MCLSVGFCRVRAQNVHVKLDLQGGWNKYIIVVPLTFRGLEQGFAQNMESAFRGGGGGV